MGVNVHIPVVWLQMLLPNSKVLKEEFSLFSIKPGCFKSLGTIHCHSTSTTSKEVSMKPSKLRAQTHKTTNNLRLVLCSLPAVFSQILSDLQIYVKKFQSTSCKLYIDVIHVLCFLFLFFLVISGEKIPGLDIWKWEEAKWNWVMNSV